MFKVRWHQLPFLSLEILHLRTRSSRPEVSCKKGVHRNFTKFTRKQLCQSLFSNKVAGLKLATLLKKRLWHKCFPVNFVKFLRAPSIEHLWWLLLKGFSVPWDGAVALKVLQPTANRNLSFY